MELLINNVLGTIANDFLTGTDRNDAIDGKAGDDFLYAQAGDNGLNWNVGNDDPFCEPGVDALNGGEGQDAMFGGNGINAIKGGALLSGGETTDVLTGGRGSDAFLLTTAGGDRITDFNATEDALLLSVADFMRGLTPGRPLSAAKFEIAQGRAVPTSGLYTMLIAVRFSMTGMV